MVSRSLAIGGLVVVVLLFVCVFVLMKSYGMVEFGQKSKTIPPYLVKDGRIPPALACMVIPGGAQKTSWDDCVGIWAFNDIYASIGVTSREFKEWEDKYGMSSLGTDGSGHNIAPGYPVFSKIAWMSIDPITLTAAETQILEEECDRAIPHSVSESARRELENLRDLAKKSRSLSYVVQFGHP